MLSRVELALGIWNEIKAQTRTRQLFGKVPTMSVSLAPNFGQIAALPEGRGVCISRISSAVQYFKTSSQAQVVNTSSGAGLNL